MDKCIGELFISVIFQLIQQHDWILKTKPFHWTSPVSVVFKLFATVILLCPIWFVLLLHFTYCIFDCFVSAYLLVLYSGLFIFAMHCSRRWLFSKSILYCKEQVPFSNDSICDAVKEVLFLCNFLFNRSRIASSPPSAGLPLSLWLLSELEFKSLSENMKMLVIYYNEITTNIK